MDAFRAKGGGERLRLRVPLAPSPKAASSIWKELWEALVTFAGGLYFVYGARGGPLSLGFGYLLLALAVDGAVGTMLNRLGPAYLLTREGLCKKGNCRSLESLRALRLEKAHPYLTRVDKPGELRIVLDWGDARWRVPLTYVNWEALWERLRRLQSGLPCWKESPEVLRALAEAHEVPYYLPPGVEVEVIEPPSLVRAAIGIGLLLFIFTMAYVTAVLGINAPANMVVGLAALLGTLLYRKLRRSRVVVRGNRLG